MPYERQLETKQTQVEDALERIGKFDHVELEPIVPAEQTWRYRNKLEYSFGTDASGGLVCGFHAPGRWDQIVAMDDCLLASEAGNRARKEVVSWCLDQNLSAFDRREHGGFLRNLVVREGRRTGELLVRLITSSGELDRDSLAAATPSASGLLWTQTDSLAETTEGGETESLRGPPYLEERLGELSIRISAQAFFQTNTEMAEQLYELAAEFGELSGSDRLFDLYCGIGTIGLSMAPRVAEVWGVELSENAVSDAIVNARLNEVDNARFFAGDVRLALRELVERAGKPDVVVVDPPRAGLSKKVVRRLIEASPRRIVYVSCNPTTLAPNAAQLAEAGYRLARVRALDLFPQTPHIECVALLERR